MAASSNPHLADPSTEHPYIFLLTWKDETARFGPEIDLADPSSLLTRCGEDRFRWHKTSDQSHRLAHAYLDLAIEFPDDIGRGLDVLQFGGCCRHSPTRVEAFQTDAYMT